MSTPTTLRRYFKIGRVYHTVALDYVPSWDHQRWPRFDAWWHVRRPGFTVRYRGWLLIVCLGGKS